MPVKATFIPILQNEFYLCIFFTYCIWGFNTAGKHFNHCQKTLKYSSDKFEIVCTKHTPLFFSKRKTSTDCFECVEYTEGRGIILSGSPAVFHHITSCQHMVSLSKLYTEGGMICLRAPCKVSVVISAVFLSFIKKKGYRFAVCCSLPVCAWRLYVLAGKTWWVWQQCIMASLSGSLAELVWGPI